MTGKFPVMHKIIKKNVKFQLTNRRGYGILLKKTKKVGASASPPAAGKEVNSVSRVPGGVVCFVARMPRAFAFLFWIGGASVLARYSIN